MTADKLLRTRAVVGTKAERQSFRQNRQAALREKRLAQMTPEQRKVALKNESDNKAASQAKAKLKRENKILRTTAITGSKQERKEFRAEKQSILRERALARMTPEQREIALKNESANKAAEEAKAKQKRDDKILRTKAIIGSKQEREEFNTEKQGILRERALAQMTPEQREIALKKEADSKEAKALRDKNAADAKERRTVAKVLTKEERAAKQEKDKDGQSQEPPEQTPPPAPKPEPVKPTEPTPAPEPESDSEGAPPEVAAVGTPTQFRAPGQALAGSVFENRFSDLERQVAMLA